MRQLHLATILTVAMMLLGCVDSGSSLRVNNGAASDPKPARPVFGPAMLLPNGRTLMFPFWLESEPDTKFASSSLGGSSVGGSISIVGSGWSAGQYIRWNNVAIYDPYTEKSRLLLDKPAVICRFESGLDNKVMLNGNMLFAIATADTNHDGVINSDDAVQLFRADGNGDHLTPVTPPDTQLVDLQTFGVDLFIRLRCDSDGDHKFTERDNVEVFQTSVTGWEPIKSIKLDALARNAQAAATRPSN